MQGQTAKELPPSNTNTNVNAKYECRSPWVPPPHTHLHEGLGAGAHVPLHGAAVQVNAADVGDQQRIRHALGREAVVHGRLVVAHEHAALDLGLQLARLAGGKVNGACNDGWATTPSFEIDDLRLGTR